MKPYHFLLDHDVSKAASLFPRKRTRTTLQAGLPEDASDAAIVEKAWRLSATIVTANGDHFIKEIVTFQKHMMRNECHDLFGLVILPNRYEMQKKVLENAEKRLRFNGKSVTWDDVSARNYCVRLQKSGSPRITTFPKCIYCRKLEEG